MQSSEIEDAIIHLANKYWPQQSYKRIEELLDGEFFYSILTNHNIKNEDTHDKFGLSMGKLENTLSILKKFYNEYDSILEHNDYWYIIEDDGICTEIHVVLITELVIGVLLKKADNEKWMELIMNFEEVYSASLVELIQKMSDLLDKTPQNNTPKQNSELKEMPLKWFGSNKEVVHLKKTNAELQEWVLTLESENKRLTNTNVLLQKNIDESTKANEDLYEKYELASKKSDYEQVKSECDKLESLLENKERHVKAMEIKHKDELQLLQAKNDELRQEVDLLKEKLVAKKDEVGQLTIYKRMATRMDEVDKINLDLKDSISQFKNDLKLKDRKLREKEIEIGNLNVNLNHRNSEVSQLKDRIMELESEIINQKNIKVDLHGKIDKLMTELTRANEELDDRSKRLEYAENMNFNEYSNEGLNFDLSERIKMLEEQNEDLKNMQQHERNRELQQLTTKLEELEDEKKDLIRTNHNTKKKYERFEQEREAKMLAKDKIKLLQKELSNALMEKKKVSDQLIRSYQEISRLKNYENENKSLKKDRLELLDDLRKSNKENQHLQIKLINYYETSKYGDDSQNDSDYGSPINNENQVLQNSNFMSNSKDRSGFDFNPDKSADFEESGFIGDNSKSMMISSGHRKQTSLSKYLSIPSRLNETAISSDNNINRFKKKVILEKEKEIEEKNREIDDVTKRYEDKISELNKSRNDERTNYETKLKNLGSSFKNLTRNKNRGMRFNTQRAMTPVNIINTILPEPIEADLDQIDDEDNEDLDDEDVEDDHQSSRLFDKINEMTGKYESLKQSIAQQIGESSSRQYETQRDWYTVNGAVSTVFEDDMHHHYPTTKSTWSNDFSDLDFLMSPKGRSSKPYNFD